jgi:uncharacterized protein (TIGR03435 family)
VAVLAHDAIPGPVTFGLRRAAVLLPADAESWSNSALSRALVHELEHVRRRDWLIQLLARLVCVIYWFHPLVWTAERELLLNAERACDDAVLAHASTAGDDDATAYADQLVDLAKRLSTRHQPLLAMANRYDLAVRVRALLDARQSRGPAGAWLVATVACVAGALALAISPLRVVAQSAGVQVSGDRPRFEVVSVRPCDPSAPPVPGAGRSGGAAGASPGRLHLDCTNVWTLIRNAYVSYADGRYHAPGERRVYPMPADLPDWVSRERYTIEAKAEGEPATAVMLGPMLQGVLEERFKLKLHVEAREVPVYELVVAKGGAKLGPARLDVCVPYDMSVSPQPPLGPGKHRCNEQAQSRDQDGNYVYDYEAVTLAVFLSARGPNGIDPILGRPIVNRTGITGLVSFRWVAAADRGSADGYVSRLAREFERQFGLELREGTAKREFLVIDHVERPRLETATPLPVRGHR